MYFVSVRANLVTSVITLMSVVRRYQLAFAGALITYAVLNLALTGAINALQEEPVPTVTNVNITSALPPTAYSSPTVSNNDSSNNAATPTSKCQKPGIINPAPADLTSTGVNEAINQPQNYKVYGKSIDQVKAQLKTCAPGEYLALTNYYMNWSYATEPVADNICRLANVRVGISIVNQYPEWQTPADTSSQTKRQWDSMFASLAEHEQGHTNRSIGTARELHAAMAVIPDQPCDQLIANIKHITEQYKQKLHQVNVDYDHDTSYGRTQGAVL